MWDVESLLREARQSDCSDLHFTVGLPPMIRRRGSLLRMELPEVTREQMAEVIRRIAGERHKARLDRGEDADFGYLDSSGFRQRVNVYRQRGDYAVAMRLLRGDIPTLADLKLPPVLAQFAMRPRGLVLVTGPTGSGKSTTLAAMIDHINERRAEHILTIEDPVEYLHTHKRCMVNQREVGEDVGSFAGALRAALREDPDIILVGEMRDHETISAAITAAETGHLVFSTLHTTGAAPTVDRIIDVFPPAQQPQIRTQLASVLVGVASQTLVPTVDGRGRIAAMEVLTVTDAVANMIREGKTHQIPTALQTGRSTGMQTLDSDLARLARMGIISEEEGRRRCQNAAEFARYLAMRDF